MGDVDKVGNKQQARWRDHDGRQRTKLFATKREADDHLAQIRTARNEGKPGPAPRKAGMPLRGYAQLYFLPRMRHLAPNSRTLYEAHLRNHIVPALGDRRIGQVTPGDVDLFIADITGRLAPSTVHTVHAVLHRLLRQAVRDQLLPSNPAEGIELPRRERKEWEPLPAASITALADAIYPRFRVAVWLAADAGMREGEVLGLTVGRVRFLERRIEVRQQLQNGVLCELKTRKSRRNIPVDGMVITEVARHLEQWPSDHLLITTDRGGPVSRSLFGHHWRQAAAKAGLPGEKFHSLRHWYASVMIRAGLNVKLVQERLGHSTALETLGTYLHIWPEDADVGRGVVEAMFTSPEQDRLAHRLHIPPGPQVSQ
jgi:integrase